MNEWLVVLVFSSMSTEIVVNTPVPSKEACSAVIDTTVKAYRGAMQNNPFNWAGTCVDLKNARIEKPAEIPALPPSRAPATRKPEREARS